MASIIIWPYHEIHGWTYIYLSIQYIRTNTTPRRKFLFLAGNPLPPNKYIIVLECLLHDCQCTVSVVLVTYHTLGLYVVMQKYSNTCCTVHMVIANWVRNICHNSGILKRYEAGFGQLGSLPYRRKNSILRTHGEISWLRSGVFLTRFSLRLRYVLLRLNGTSWKV